MSFVWIKISNYFFRKTQLLKVTGHVFLVRIKGPLLLLLTREYCLVKKSLMSLAFSLKSMISLPLCNRGGIQGIFLLFRKVFNIDQYCLGLVLLSNSLLYRRE